MDIVKHSSCNLEIGAPSDMQDGSCSSLPVHQFQDSNGVWSVSFWKPSAEELSLLNQGGAISLWVRASGRQHPVVGMGAVAPEIEFSFEDFIQYGRDNGANIVNGMPWSFSFYGNPVTHENDEKYFITLPEGQVTFTPKHVLLFDSSKRFIVRDKE